ncbi:MAG TPA: YbhB/YbcL family Raf kinase inhibitor-like protein [Patescibacteria group bacterium]
MRKLLLIGLIGGFAVWVYMVPFGGGLPKLSRIKPGSIMQITSSNFTNNGDIPIKFTCMGDNINPDLEFSGIPSDAQSLALIVDDPDAPSGNFTHWVVFNIKPSTKTIPEGVGVVPGVQATNSAGLKQYTGPCPPSGVHRYYFKLYALDILLPADEVIDKTYLMQAMAGHVMDQSEILGKFSKTQ